MKMKNFTFLLILLSASNVFSSPLKSQTDDDQMCSDLNEAVFSAINDHDNLTKIQALIAQGADVNCYTLHGTGFTGSPLSNAAYAMDDYQTDSDKVLKFLVQAGATQQSLDSALNGYSPRGNLALVRAGARIDSRSLLDQASFLNAFFYELDDTHGEGSAISPSVFSDNMIALFKAAHALHPVNFNVSGDNGFSLLTPIMGLMDVADVAVGQNNEKRSEMDSELARLVEMMLQLGADPNQRVKYASFPGGGIDRYNVDDELLGMAIHLGFNQIAKTLVKYGADVNYLGDTQRESWSSAIFSPLTIASKKKNDAMVNFLLDQGADPKRIEYADLLESELENGTIATLDRLLGMGLDLNNLAYGATVALDYRLEPIFWNVIFSSKMNDELEVMFKHGLILSTRKSFLNENFIQATLSDINYGYFAKKADVETQSRQIALMKMMLEKGVDVNAVNEDGQTALQLVVVAADEIYHSSSDWLELAKPDLLAIVDLLISHHADPTIVDLRAKQSVCTFSYVPQIQFIKDRVLQAGLCK